MSFALTDKGCYKQYLFLHGTIIYEYDFNKLLETYNSLIMEKCLSNIKERDTEYICYIIIIIIIIHLWF